MISRDPRIIVAIVLAIMAECAADELSKAKGPDNTAERLYKSAAAIDPSKIDIDSVESDSAFDRIEKTFARIPSTRRILPHYRRYVFHLCDTELRQLHSLANLKRSEFIVVQDGLRTVARRTILKMCQDQLRSTQARVGLAVRLNETSPIRLVEDTLIEIAERELTNQQTKRYRDEVLSRRSFREEAVVESLTASLDTHLLLSAEQRKQTIDILKSEWQDQWLLCTKLIGSSIESVPLLPMPRIRNLLRPPQLKVFSSMKWKPKTVVFGGSNQFAKAKSTRSNGDLEDVLSFAPEKTGDSK